MGQDVKLKIDGDTSGLLKAVRSAMAQIEQEAKKLKISPGAAGGAIGSPGSQSFQQSLQATRMKEKDRRDDQAALNIANNALAAKNRELDNLARKQKAVVSDKKAEAYYEEQINKALRERSSIRSTAAQLEKNLGGGGQPPPGGGGGGMFGKMGKGGVTSLSGLGMALGLPVAGIATAVAAAMAAESARTFFQQTGSRGRVAEASAFQTQGQGGQRLESFLNGGAGEEMAFNPQRMQAAQIAQAQFQQNLNSPFRSLNHKKEWFNQVTGGVFGLDREVLAQQQEEQANIQAQQFDALKNGPEGAARTGTANKYLRDWQRNLAFQRQSGFSEGGFRNFLGGVNSAGFSDEQGIGMSSAIMGAGGSTRAAQGNAGFALQMQRAFGLTNAGQAIGQISGQLGSSQMSRDALIKIQAEGTRLGLNQSDFQEENRKFVEMASNVINLSTATSGAGVDQLVSTLGRFMGSGTISGQQAGLSAYQAYQSQSNIQSGPSAAIRATGMMRDPNLSRLSGAEQASLFTMNQADVNPDDPGIQAMARKSGLSAQEFVNRYHAVQNSSIFQRAGTDSAISRLSGALQSGAVVGSGAMGPNAPGTEDLLGNALNQMPIEQAAQGLSRKAQMALVQARASGNTSEVSRLMQEGVSGAAAAGATGRPGDEMERQQAEASRLANGLFSSFKDSIIPASAAVRDFATSIDTLLKAMSGTSAQRAVALQAFNNQYPGVTPTTQPSAGPPANGAGQGPPSQSIGTHF